MKSPIPQDLRGKTISNIVVVCVGIAAAAMIMHLDQLWNVIKSVSHAAMPIFIGFAIAFIMLPAIRRLEDFFNRMLSRRKPHPKLCRILAIVITYIVMLALLSSFFAILVPQVFESLKSMVTIVTSALPRSTKDISNLIENSPLLQRLGLDQGQVMEALQGISEQLTSQLRQLKTYTNLLVNNIFAIATSISTSIYSVLFHALVGLIASVYMLLDRERFCAQAKKLCYAMMKRASCESLIYWTRRANGIFAGFIIGKLVDSLLIGMICYICMMLFRIEYPLLISVLIGVTNVIPFFGPYIGAIPSILFLLIVNPMSALWFSVFILILQQVDGNIIGPLVLGDHVGLSAFWIMLSITIGGSLFGFAGMLLSVPTFALIYAIAQTIIEKRLRSRRLPTETDRYVDAPASLKEKDV